MPKVTVVVPIYGVEPFIERCARSLFEQTLDDMEFIFVDDCTKDNSIAVLEKVVEDYPNRRDQIKIIHHEHNKGLSFARETGVNYASGDFIGHCDSDDWVDKEMYETLYKVAVSQQLDFVRCNYRMTDGEKCLAEGRLRIDGDLTDKTKIIGWAVSDQGWNSIWSTLSSRSLYSDIQFTDNSMLEDMFVVLQLITRSKKIGVVNKILYNYFYNSQSISKSQDNDAIKKRADSAYLNILWMLNYISRQYDVDKLKDELLFLKAVPRRDLIPALVEKDNYDYWNKYFKEIGFKPVFLKYLPAKMRVKYLLAELKLYPFFAKIYTNR